LQPARENRRDHENVGCRIEKVAYETRQLVDVRRGDPGDDEKSPVLRHRTTIAHSIEYPMPDLPDGQSGDA
jgi:hypothetical protein